VLGGFVLAVLAAMFVLLPTMVRSLLATVVLLATPFVLLSVVRAALRARAYARDLRDGELWRFAGALSNFDSLALDRDLARLAQRGAFTPEPGAEQDIVVLRHASELLHVNGKWAPRGLRLRVSHVVAPPERAVKLALPAE